MSALYLKAVAEMRAQRFHFGFIAVAVFQSNHVQANGECQAPFSFPSQIRAGPRIGRVSLQSEIVISVV